MVYLGSRRKNKTIYSSVFNSEPTFPRKCRFTRFGGIFGQRTGSEGHQTGSAVYKQGMVRTALTRRIQRYRFRTARSDWRRAPSGSYQISGFRAASVLAPAPPPATNEVSPDSPSEPASNDPPTVPVAATGTYRETPGFPPIPTGLVSVLAA